MEKKELRKHILLKRNSLNSDELQAFSSDIFDKITNLEEFKNKKVILCYVSFNNEVDTINLIEYSLKIGKVVAVPKVEGNAMEFYRIKDFSDLKPGYFGVLEPEKNDKNVVDPDDSFMIIPGVAFDRKMNRIGYGKGFYDRFLTNYIGKRIIRCGICFELQLCDKIENDEFDQSLDMIITEKNIYKE